VTDKQDGSATDKPDGSVVATGGLILSTVKAIQDGINRVVGTGTSDDAIWRIRWESIMFAGHDAIPGYYALRNRSNAAKYSVSVEGPSGGRNTWHAIYEQQSRKLDSPYEPQSDEQISFIVRWRAGQGRFSRVRKRKVWSM
jgi:hypothetical protein